MFMVDQNIEDNQYAMFDRICERILAGASTISALAEQNIDQDTWESMILNKQYEIFPDVTLVQMVEQAEAKRNIEIETALHSQAKGQLIELNKKTVNYDGEGEIKSSQHVIEEKYVKDPGAAKILIAQQEAQKPVRRKKVVNVQSIIEGFLSEQGLDTLETQALNAVADAEIVED